MAKFETRVLYHDTFEGKGFTDENSLANALLLSPDKINPVITHLAGKESDKFPLSFLTEGQVGGVETIKLNDIQYTWPTFKRLRLSDVVVSSQYTSGDKPGLDGVYFYVTMETDWLIVGHLIQSPNGVQARIQSRPTRVGNNFKYELALANATPGTYVSLAELAAGTKWTMVGGAPVSQSRSRGNESNTVMPGSMKNQISILRKSREVVGNIGNKTVEVQFNVDGANGTNYWLPFEEWQFMIQMKQAFEEHYWYSEYNRQEDGSIKLIDEDSGKPIPIGAGVIDQIPNSDTYAELTTKKLKTIVSDIFYGATDTTNMQVVLYTGEGGMEEFDNAIKTDSFFTQIAAGGTIGDKFVQGGAGSHSLSFGGFFNMYRHVDGHTITVKKLNLLDMGGKTENSHLHPVSGKPLESYRMFFLDQSVYDGENNVKMVTERGRSMIRGVEKGMNEISLDYKGNNTELVSTDEDSSWIHYLCAKGICIRRNTHCFKLEPDTAVLG